MGSLALPFYLYLFMGESVQFEIMSIIRQIAIIVFIPMIFGHLTRTWLVRKHGESGFKEKIAPRFSSFSTIGVLGIVFIAISLKSDYLMSNLDSLLYILAASVSMYVINYLLSTIIGRCFFTGKDAIALVYGTVMRNLSIALAISMNSFGDIGSQIALVIAIAFIIQVQSAAWYIRFTQVLFKDK